MVPICFKLIVAFITCVLLVAGQKLPLAEKISQTPDDHVVHEFANLRGVNSIRQCGNTTAVATSLLHNIEKIPIDQFSRSLADRLERYIVTVIGAGIAGNSVDGIAAMSAQIGRPYDVKVDGTGNIYFVDIQNNLVRKMTLSTGRITTIAGLGPNGYYNGDDIAATSAKLKYPRGIDLDGMGNVYIADSDNHRVRKVTVSTGIITTIAGRSIPYSVGQGGYDKDNIAATSALLNYPQGVAIETSGNVYIADTFNHRVRKVTVSTGIITTIAGTGSPGYNTDNIAATSAMLNFPPGVAIDGSGNVYIADSYNKRVRKVKNSTGIITTIAGTGFSAFTNADNIAATAATLGDPEKVAVDGLGNVYISSTSYQIVRKVTVSTGMITTFAGTGDYGYNGDNIVATTAKLNAPQGITIDGSGNVYIADSSNYRIRLIRNVTLTASPSGAPSMAPTSYPSAAPSVSPTACPSAAPSVSPTSCPSDAPSVSPTSCPSAAPSMSPTSYPSAAPSVSPTSCPSAAPSMTPTSYPSAAPSVSPTSCPSAAPSMTPTSCPSAAPSVTPTSCPSAAPSLSPTSCPSTAPSVSPTASPSAAPSVSPTSYPSAAPSVSPTSCPSAAPSMTPTSYPSAAPSMSPTSYPSAAPSVSPTSCPSTAPSVSPTASPSAAPSVTPTSYPSAAPSMSPTVSPSVVDISPLCKDAGRPSSASSNHLCKTRKPTFITRARSPV